MARSVNEADRAAKREAILDAAQRFVETKGYEQTSIQDVLDDLGISKGAFYHYFDSKQAVLLALVDRRGDTLDEVMRAVVENPRLTATEKLSQYFTAQDSFKRQRKRFVLELTRVWFSDENAVFRQRMSAEGRRRLAPWLIRIIEQGVAEGTFRVDDPGQTARIIMSIVDGLAETIAESLDPGGRLADEASLRAAAIAAADAIERVLGTVEGVLGGEWLEALAEW